MSKENKFNQQFWGVLAFSIGLILVMLVFAPSPLVFTKIFDIHSPWHQILIDIRLPRVIGGFCIGALLASCGALIQGLFRNPLAEPSLIGVSSGAALGASLSLFYGLASWMLPVTAFAGAVCAVILLIWIGRRLLGQDISQFILVGVALNFTTISCIGLLSYLSPDAVMRSISFWTMGSLGSLNRNEMFIIAGTLFTSYFLLRRRFTALNVWLLGEHTARQMGINSREFTAIMVTLISLMIAVAVAFSGVVGFVGLLVPHAVRYVVGMDHKKLIPMSMLVGGCLLVLADWLSQVIAPPAQIPLSIILSIAGGPLFIALLYRVQRKGWG